MDRKKALLFQLYHLNKASSTAKASLPQSPHDASAIPLMKSALVSDMRCLQLGHLYCLVVVISTTIHNLAFLHLL